MNKLMYLGMSILDMSNIAKCDYWYDYKNKYRMNARICYMDTNSFIVHVKSEDIYKGLVEDIEKRCI